MLNLAFASIMSPQSISQQGTRSQFGFNPPITDIWCAPPYQSQVWYSHRHWETKELLCFSTMPAQGLRWCGWIPVGKFLSLFSIKLNWGYHQTKTLKITNDMMLLSPVYSPPRTIQKLFNGSKTSNADVWWCSSQLIQSTWILTVSISLSSSSALILNML